MMLSILFGALGGVFLPELVPSIKILGEIFLRLLMMLIVPVVVVSMISGILNLGDTESLGRLGLKAIVYYTATTAIAVLTGLILVNIIEPGKSGGLVAAVNIIPEVGQVAQVAGHGGLTEVIKGIFPKNIFEAASKGNILGLIFFSIFLGLAILNTQHKVTHTVRELVDCLFGAIIWMVDKVMYVAPFGIFSLVANLTLEFYNDDRLVELGTHIGSYTVTVLCGLFFHGVISLSLLALVFKVNPLKLFKALFPAISTSFSTASSSMTLPITIDCLEKRAGVSNKVAGFVAPLGATANMDGTAIYEAIAAIFIANMYGVDLTFPQQFAIFITATFSAIGAAGIPGAGLVMMTMVLGVVNLPLEGIQLIVVVDRVLDMVRTSVNVWGDSVGSAIIAVSEGDKVLEDDGT